MTELSIPVIDVAALFAGPSGERDAGAAAESKQLNIV